MSIARFLVNHLPYVGRLRKQAQDAGVYPPGHFYSPIPARDDISSSVRSIRSDFSELRFNKEKQFERLRSFSRFYADLPFPHSRSERTRYYYDQTVFCYGDAIFLHCFLRHTQPMRIVEVGSGFSSAVMLDTIDQCFKQRPETTFIEPYAATLRALLRPSDATAVTIVEKKVQDVPLETFGRLGSGDLLFIDSSHVVKYGSDVQFLVFDVLPRLRPGVFVHFHDIFNGFEYPGDWLSHGLYWNEAYFLRAFLAYNSEWEIYFFNSYVGEVFREFLAREMPMCLKNIGGSLYLQRLASNSH